MSRSPIPLTLLTLLGVALGFSQTPPPNHGSSSQTPPAARTASPTGTDSATQAAAREQAAQPSLPEVVASNQHVRTTTWAALDRTVTVVLAGLRDWSGKAGNDPNNLRLFLAGRMIPDLEPSVIVLSQEYVNFELSIKPRDVLVGILTAARRAPGHALPLSVGLKDTKQPFDSKQFLVLGVYPRWAPVVVAGVGLLAVGLVLLGWRSMLLRDTSAGPRQDGPFSLAKCQMAWWFALVVGAYLYIWLITGESNPPTGSVLALIGISSGTGLAAIVIDREKQYETEKKRTALNLELTALSERIGTLTKAAPATGTELYSELQQKSFRLNQVNAELASVPPKRTTPLSKNFFLDLIRDGDGVSFHRFQIAIWTLVLTVVFIRSVSRDLAMPDFDATLLGLMGISSGTYLGFKFPEKPK